MSEILLRAEDARSAAAFMKSAAGRAQDEFTATRTRLTELSSSFKGKTATNFDAQFEKWRSSATELIQALNDLGTFLDTAANTIEQVDQDIAGQLGG
jgi:WXG100 family type VII secretion target